MLIAKRFTFDAAHRLESLPSTHKCNRLHGHTYEVEIRLEGPIDGRGFVVDYQEIADAWQQIHDLVDHRYLNDVPGLATPSTEILVQWIAAHLLNGPLANNLHSLRVAESSTTWAEWTRFSDRARYQAGP